MAKSELLRVRTLAKRRQQLRVEFRQAILAAYRSGAKQVTIAHYAGLSPPRIKEILDEMMAEEKNA